MLWPAAVAQQPLLFSDQTTSQGVAFTHHAVAGDQLNMGAGGAWGDYDGDGDLDLYVADQVGANRLFKNLGAGAGFVNVAAQLGVEDAGSQGTGALWGDYDNDDDKDLYVMNRGNSVMFRNDGPGGPGGWIFTDVTAELGVAAFGRTSAAAYGDYDRDGWLDLYVANHNYPLGFPVAGDPFREDFLFHNVAGSGGQRVFVNVAPQVFGAPELNGIAHSVAFFDYDNDTDVDIYVANEVLRDPSLHGNLLWRNDGSDGAGGWRFTDVTAISGTTLRKQPMGLAVGDYNGDGWLDFAMSDSGPTYLYQNNGGVFTERGDAAGVRRARVPVTNARQIGWGLVFFDYNLDGAEDLYVATGELSKTDTLQPNPLFRNNGNPPNTTFTDVTDISGANDTLRSRTVIKGDYDGDGDEDLYVVNYGQAAHLYRNDQAASNYLALQLEGALSNRDAIGARVKVSTAGLPDQYRMVQSGSTTGGGNDLTLLFGLPGVAIADSVTIDWPSGQQTVLTSIATRQRLHVVESTTVPTPTISVSDVQVTESTASAVFSVQLSSASPAAVMVDYATANDSAVSGADFIATSGTLTIPSGSVTAVITVPLVNDTIDEATTERFFLRLSNPVSATIADSEADAVIQDDDGFLLIDDFSDGIQSWTPTGGAWTESAGTLVGASPGGLVRATAPLPWSPSGDSSCSVCTIEATLQTSGGLGNKVGLIGWRAGIDWLNYVELTLEEEANRWVLAQYTAGAIAARKVFTQTLDPNVSYAAKMSFDGANVNAWVNGVLVITLPVPSAPTGNVAFRVSKTTGTFDSMRVY